MPPGQRPRRSSRSPLLAVLLVFGLIGGTLSEREAGECFRDGCQHVFYREGHKGVATFEKFTAPAYRLRIRIDLYW